MTVTYKSMLRWKNCRIMILLLAEELSAVPTMVASLSKREANRAAGAAVHHLVLHPVVCCRTAGLVADRPAKHSATAVTYQDFTVVPGERKAQSGKEEREKQNNFISYFQKYLLGLNNIFSKQDVLQMCQRNTSVYKKKLISCLSVWFDPALLLGDGEGSDLGWVSVVLAIKSRVHGELTPEDQLALPSVACERTKTNT